MNLAAALLQYPEMSLDHDNHISIILSSEDVCKDVCMYGTILISFGHCVCMYKCIYKPNLNSAE